VRNLSDQAAGAFIVGGSAGDKTVVVPATQRAVVVGVHVSSVTGGALQLTYDTALNYSLGTIAANGRIDLETIGQALMGALGFDIILDGPADMLGFIHGYLIN
jgi:hypothetical protein